jgi:hypothetical protein
MVSDTDQWPALPGRLRTGHRPLEARTLVQIQARQSVLNHPSHPSREGPYDSENRPEDTSWSWVLSV